MCSLFIWKWRHYLKDVIIFLERLVWSTVNLKKAFPGMNHFYAQINKRHQRIAGGYSSRNVVLQRITIKMRITIRKIMHQILNKASLNSSSKTDYQNRVKEFCHTYYLPTSWERTNEFTCFSRCSETYIFVPVLNVIYVWLLISNIEGARICYFYIWFRVIGKVFFVF